VARLYDVYPSTDAEGNVREIWKCENEIRPQRVFTKIAYVCRSFVMCRLFVVQCLRSDVRGADRSDDFACNRGKYIVQSGET
jgi:hypothetical protein